MARGRLITVLKPIKANGKTDESTDKVSCGTSKAKFFRVTGRMERNQVRESFRRNP